MEALSANNSVVTCEQKTPLRPHIAFILQGGEQLRFGDVTATYIAGTEVSGAAPPGDTCVAAMLCSVVCFRRRCVYNSAVRRTAGVYAVLLLGAPQAHRMTLFQVIAFFYIIILLLS